MQDIKVSQDENGKWDFEIEDSDFGHEDGLDSAIWASLLTDQRAPADLVAIPEYRRGWVGDIVSPVEGREIGSLLWLTDQRRLTQLTLNECVGYARDALNWMIEDGLCKNIQVSGIIVAATGITLEIIITSYDGSSRNRFVDLWKVTGV